MANVTIVGLCLLIFGNVNAAKDFLTEDCTVENALATCAYGGGRKMLKTDEVNEEVERVEFDRLPVRVDLLNSPNVRSLDIKDKFLDLRSACEHVVNNKLPVRVYFGTDKPVECVSTILAFLPAQYSEP